jgi:hypothetical protein
METNNNTAGGKAKNFLQKMYRFRVKVDKQGKSIINVSSIFGLFALIFAPHVTIIGTIAALLMGYQFRFESEDMDDKELEERIRKAAMNVKSGAASAVKSIQTEISKARAQNAPKTQAEAEQMARQIVEKAAAPQEPAPSNQEILNDLQQRADSIPETNPAATTFHSAYAASAGSVPVLRVSEDPTPAPEPEAPAARGSME